MVHTIKAEMVSVIPDVITRLLWLWARLFSSEHLKHVNAACGLSRIESTSNGGEAEVTAKDIPKGAMYEAGGF